MNDTVIIVKNKYITKVIVNNLSLQLNKLFNEIISVGVLVKMFKNSLSENSEFNWIIKPRIINDTVKNISLIDVKNFSFDATLAM